MSVIHRTIDGKTGKTIMIEVPECDLDQFCEEVAIDILSINGDYPNEIALFFSKAKVREDILAGSASYEGAKVVVI